MGLFFRSRSEVTTKRAESLQEALGARAGTGRTAAPVTFDSALTLSAVWGCSMLLADLLGTLPVDAYRKVGKIDEAIKTPPVLISPAGEELGIEEWLSAGQLALELRGNNYGIIAARDSFGLPKQIELVHPDTVAVKRSNATGELVYRVSGKAYSAFEMWHERANLVPGSPVGLSTISAGARAMGVGIAAEQYGSDWFADGAHPTTIFQNKTMADVNTPAAKAFKERVMAATRGNREPLVLGSGWDINQLQVSPTDAALVESLEISERAACRFFRVPPEMVGVASGGQSITYANIEQRMLGFLVTSLGPRITRRERALSRLLPRPQHVKLNRNALLAVDLGARYRAYQTGIASKFLTQNEARAWENLPPLSDADIALLTQLGSGPALPAALINPDGTQMTDPATGEPITVETGA